MPSIAVPDAFDAATLAYYDDVVATYLASGEGGTNRNLSTFLARLASESFILDLGCGGAIDARAMLNAGFRVDATDGSPCIARKAEQALGQAVRVMLRRTGRTVSL